MQSQHILVAYTYLGYLYQRCGMSKLRLKLRKASHILSTYIIVFDVEARIREQVSRTLFYFMGVSIGDASEAPLLFPPFLADGAARDGVA